MTTATPHFIAPPPLGMVLLTVLVPPATYIAAGSAISARAATWLQPLFLLLPAVLLLAHSGVRHFFAMENLTRRALITVLAATGLAAVLNALLPWWNGIFPFPADVESFYLEIIHPGSVADIAAAIASLALIPAVCEEALFRGVLQTSLCRLMGRAPAVIVSSAAFSLYHLNPWYAPFFFILGAFFGTVFLSTRNLGLAMLAHCLNNLVGLAWTYRQ